MFARAPHALRNLPSSSKTLYLTFDDGPDPETTPRVLDLLEKHKARATFFVVAERARKEPQLLERIRTTHAIGDHSLDHGYSLFFKQMEPLKNWIESSTQKLADFKVQSVGFRPPAGICTPPLIEALAQLEVPLILWEHRFYDTTLSWTPRRMRKVLPKLKTGDLLLLHDRQKSTKRETFCETLDLFLHEATTMGWSFSPLPRDLSSRIRHN